MTTQCILKTQCNAGQTYYNATYTEHITIQCILHVQQSYTYYTYNKAIYIPHTLFKAFKHCMCSTNTVCTTYLAPLHKHEQNMLLPLLVLSTDVAKNGVFDMQCWRQLISIYLGSVRLTYRCKWWFGVEWLAIRGMVLVLDDWQTGVGWGGGGGGGGGMRLHTVRLSGSAGTLK